MSSNSFDLVLKNGQCVVRNEGDLRTVTTDIGIQNGKIAVIGQIDKEQSAQFIDCRGLTILPGLIDSQVHFREPGLEFKEDLESGSRGAVKGGITAVFDMPNTKPPLTHIEQWQDKMNRAHSRMWCDYAFYAGATLKNLDQLSSLENQQGCCGTKIFMGSSTGDLLVDQLDGLKTIVGRLKRNIAVHSEDETRLKERAEFRIHNQPESHATWRDDLTALHSTQNLIQIAIEQKRKVHVLHVSTWQEMEFLKKHKPAASVEVTPQHLTLSAPEAYERLGTLAQMNPPIRSKEHQAALWKAVADNTVDVIGSDHAPHTLEEKNRPYPASPSGMTGVQTTVPLMLNHVHSGYLSLHRLVELLAENPAKIFKMPNKGQIRTGYDADFTIVDLKRVEKIKNNWIESKVKWTPYDNMTVTGWPVITILRGQVVMQDNQLQGEPSGSPLKFSDLKQ